MTAPRPEPQTKAGRRPCVGSDWPQMATGYRKRSIAGRYWYAHRWAWTLAFGPIPSGMHVCHTCDNRSCIEPTHLWLGTNAENTADKVAKGRQARGPQMQQPRFGQSNGRARVSESDVREMRRRSAAGESGSAIARDYGLAATTVRRIVTGRYWPRV